MLALNMNLLSYSLSQYVATAIVLLYFVYRWALPKPIPGDIPYNKDAVRSLFGDIPAMLEYMRKTDEPFTWVQLQTVNLQSPIIQLFARPFSKPWVVIADFREAKDISSARRMKEFDRSDYFRDLLSGVLPRNHVWMKTNHQWKYNRGLIQDLMTPTFLHGVAAPRLHLAISNLVAFWKEKVRLANGHPFSATDDICLSALDAVWSFAFGVEKIKGASKAGHDHLAKFKSIELPTGVNEPVMFSEHQIDECHRAVLTITERIGKNQQSLFPRWNDWLWSLTPEQRGAYSLKENFIKEGFDEASARFGSATGLDTQEVGCALDYMFKREIISARKAGRPPHFHTREMYDEVKLILKPETTIR
jgi:hypothetical protein